MRRFATLRKDIPSRAGADCRNSGAQVALRLDGGETCGLSPRRRNGFLTGDDRRLRGPLGDFRLLGRLGHSSAGPISTHG